MVPSGAVLDDLTRLASQICRTRMSLLTFVDETRVWFQSRHGIAARETPRAGSFCAEAIRTPDRVFEIADARSDARFRDAPLVAREPFVRFYAGAPFTTSEGATLGALCVLDTEPRELDANQRETLRVLARQVIAHIELRDRSAMLEAILNTSVAAIVHLDTSGRILFANPRGEEVLGLRRDAIIGRTYDSPEWRHTGPNGEEWPDEQQPFRRVMATGRPVFDVQHAIEWPDGRRRQLSVNGAPIHDARGELASLVFSVTDITERRRLEAELLQLQKMEALGTLAGGIAHDFNNLLAVILANLDCATHDARVTDSTKQSLLDARVAARRGRDLVQQILTFSRKQPMERSAVDVAKVVSDVTALLRTTLPPGVELRSRLAKGTPEVFAAPSQLHQVLLNLTLNASQAIRDGKGHIDIEVATVELGRDDVAGLRAGRYVRLSVTDDGVGMDGPTLERIFDPFFTTKRPGEGTGLGLAVVDGIVKNHDGAIVVQSKPAVGTTFQVFIPAAAPFDEAQEPAPISVPHRSARVLCIDDEELLVRVVVRTLHAAGHEVSGYVDAEEALAAFAADPWVWDVVLTDLNMPKTSGLDVAHRVHAIRPDLPVVVASGFVSSDLAARASLGGAVYVLAKPHSRRELEEAIERALSGGPRSSRGVTDAGRP